MTDPAGTPVSGTATVVLGDIAGSTRKWQEHPEAMAAASQRLAELLDRLVADHGGHRPREQGEGDNFVAVFAAAGDAAAFAIALDMSLAVEAWPGDLDLAMRIGLHTGDVTWSDETGYLGPTFNRCARIRDLGHARMILLSQATRDIVADTLPDRATITDLGSHQLRDLSRDEHVFQLTHPDSPDDFAPLKSVTSLPNNLPIPVTSLIGREEDIARVSTALIDHRLVTLTGAGGSGKTRLAQHVASNVLHLAPDGAWWVDLSPVNDDRRVPVVMAEAASIDEIEGKFAAHLLAGAIGDKQMLLVLDNCEHVIDAVADTAEILLAQCRDVRILATSRETLDIDGEHSVRVRPLGVPEVKQPTHADLLDEPATALFLERASMLDERTLDANARTSVSNICRRLDGMPLAIELAAARTRMLSLEDIETALDDRFGLLTSGRRGRRSGARQRNLEASIAWSYDLLDEEEQAMLCRLAVFPSAFDLDGAREVGNLGDGASAMELLSALVDKSLVSVRPAEDGRRYHLLETIRHYGLQRLAERGDADDARHAHLDHTLGRIQALVDEHVSWDGSIGPVVDVGSALVEDIRAADAWAHESGRAADVVDLHWPFQITHVLTGAYRDVIAGLVELLDHPDLDLERRARLHSMVVADLASAGRYRRALELSDRAVALGRQLQADMGHDAPLIATLSGIAWAQGWSGLDATDAAQECIHLARESAADSGVPGRFANPVTFCLMPLAFAGHDVTAYDVAEEAFEAATAAGFAHVRANHAIVRLSMGMRTGRPLTEMARLLDDARTAIPDDSPRLHAVLATPMGLWWSAMAGDLDEMRSWEEHGLAHAGPPGTATHTFMMLGQAFHAEMAGDFETAARLAGGAADLFARTENTWWLAQAHLEVARAKVAQGDPDALDALATTRRLLPETTFPLLRSWLDCFTAIALAHTDPEAAWEAVTTALPVLNRGYTSQALTVLPAVALAMVTSERPTDGARALGALQRAAEERGWSTQLAWEVGRAEAACRAALDDEAFEDHVASGRQLSLDDVVDWLLDDDAPRLDRPVVGWDALTPAELQVARKVAEGLTNAEVADAQFVSANTVKTHLKSIYTKLDIGSRAELAAVVTRQAHEEHSP